MNIILVQKEVDDQHVDLLFDLLSPPPSR